MITCKVVTTSGLIVWCELTSMTIKELRTQNVKIITGGKK